MQFVTGQCVQCHHQTIMIKHKPVAQNGTSDSPFWATGSSDLSCKVDSSGLFVMVRGYIPCPVKVPNYAANNFFFLHVCAKKGWNLGYIHAFMMS